MIYQLKELWLEVNGLMNLKKIIQQLYYILLILIFPIEILAQQNKITLTQEEKKDTGNILLIPHF